MKLVKSMAILAALAAIVFFSSPAPAADSALTRAKQRGTLKIGFDTFVPWAMKDKQGRYIGFEIDVAARVAGDMGLKPEFVPTKWDGIIPALLTGKFDVIIGGMGITPERRQKVDFTIPYEHSGMSIMAHKKLAAGFKSLEDFNKPNVVIAAKLGTTAAEAVKKFMPQAQARLFGDEAQAVQELLNGNAQAMVASAPLPAHQVYKNQDKLFLPLAETFTKEPIGMALKKGDSETLNYLNVWIKKAEAEGWLKERMHYWFETMDWESQLK
ncbi:MAG: transporter substrate-binding domain-containing protein [Thermodesulfobacteriota bacterium]